MFSACPDIIRQILTAVAGLALWTVTATAAPVWRVAADPNNLPFSNERGEGFENRVITLLAERLGAEVEWVWHAQRRGFFRQTMTEGECDLVAGVPAGLPRLLTTRPYYRSGYVMLHRAGDPAPESLDDPRLAELALGVQMVGDDFANTPPAHALSRRGHIANVRGYTLYGDYTLPNPPARIVDALARGEVDVAFAWGPLAGYFARQAAVPLVLTQLPETDAATGLPLAFSISIGVSQRRPELRAQLDQALVAYRDAIESILAAYGVPQLALTEPVGGSADEAGRP